MRKWLLLAAAIAMEVSATLSLRGAIEHPALYVVVVLGYVGAFTALGFILRCGLPVGIVYGIWAAVGITLTALFGAVFFENRFTPVMLLGVGTVTSGVVLLQYGRRDQDGSSDTTEGDPE